MNINGGLCQNGLVLTGKDLERYTKRKGLCRKCALVVTHKRAGKLFKRNKFEALTVKNGEEYVVYKGYCIQPTCYTLDEAMELLGEKPLFPNGDSMRSVRHLRSSVRAGSCGLELTYKEIKPKATQHDSTTEALHDSTKETRRDSTTESRRDSTAESRRASITSPNLEGGKSSSTGSENLLLAHESPSYNWSHELPLIHLASFDNPTNQSASGRNPTKYGGRDNKREPEKNGDTRVKCCDDESTLTTQVKHPSRGKTKYKKGLKKMIVSLRGNNDTDERAAKKDPKQENSSVSPVSLTSVSSSASMSSDDSTTLPKPLPGSGFVSSTTSTTGKSHRGALEALGMGVPTAHNQLKTLCLRYKKLGSQDVELFAVDDETSLHSWLMDEFLVDGGPPNVVACEHFNREVMVGGNRYEGPKQLSESVLKASKYTFTLLDNLKPKSPIQASAQMGRDRSVASDFSSSLDSTISGKTLGVTDVRMTVFQSAPLAYVDSKTGIHHECPLLDFDYEARALTQALRDVEGANVDLQFDIATTDRLSAFLAKSESRVMHLSCHGHTDYLALENGFGGMQVLPVRDLKRFIGAGTGNLEVVFVSACHSKAAGKAFLEAGIRHVICCRQDDKFRDEGAIEFARGFYRALALNNTLKQAFKMAQEATRVSPMVLNSEVEYEKFLLLPELPDNDPYHDVRIFSKTYQALPGMIDEITIKPKPRILPRVPQFFVGREKDMYMVIEALRFNDIIQVQGSRGIGKTSLVAATVRYIEQRRKSFFFDDVFWLPAQKGAIQANDTLYLNLSRIMYMMIRARERPCQIEHRYRDYWGDVVGNLHDKRILLVIHGSHLTSEASKKSLEYFLLDLLKVANAKVIIIGVPVLKHDLLDATIVNIQALDYDASVLAFARLVRSPSTSGQQITACLTSSFPKQSEGASVDQLVAWRRRQIFEMIGKGIPAAIRRAALDMSQEELSSLLALARRPLVGVSSRYELDAKIRVLNYEEAQHSQKRDFLRAGEIQKTMKELEYLKNNFPTLKELGQNKKILKESLQKAIASKQYENANEIQQNIGRIQQQIANEIQQEQEAMRILRLASF